MPLTKEERKVLDSVQIMFTKQEDDYLAARANQLYRTNKVKGDTAEMTAKRERRQRLEKVGQIRENCRIQLPTVSLQGESYGTSFKENIGAKKRKSRSNNQKSRLYRKRVNASTVEGASGTWEQTLAGRTRDLEKPEGCLPGDFRALSQFLTEDKDHNRTLIPGQMQEGNLTREQIASCISQYMALDMGVDLRTDETIAEESVRLEELAGKTEGLKHLLDGHPEMTAQMTEEEKQNLLVKLDMGNQIAEYYAIQKKVMTNSWYRTHYNSEITYKCHLGDTLEQRNLALLLWQAEFVRNREAFQDDRAGRDWLLGYNEEVSKQEAKAEAAAKAWIQKAPKTIEFGKGGGAIPDSRHAEYFRQHSGKEDPVYRRIRTDDYYVVGEPHAMHEGLCRHIANLPRLEAIQHMDKKSFQQMMDDLIRLPVHMSDPEEVEACRQANLNGVRMYKDLLKKQINYLKRKYGNGFLLLPPDEFTQYADDFEHDFTNMQGMSFFVKYLKKLPGMFDPDDSADRDLEQWITYYQAILVSDGYARTDYSKGTHKSFSSYKLGAMFTTMNGEETRMDVIKSSGELHLDVRWGTFFDENDVLFDEVLKCAGRIPADRLQEEDLRHYTWNQLTEETRRMPRSEAIRHFIEKEYVIAQEKQEFDSDLQGRVQTAGRMLEKLDQRRTESAGGARALYDQMCTDIADWLRENRGY